MQQQARPNAAPSSRRLRTRSSTRTWTASRVRRGTSARCGRLWRRMGSLRSCEGWLGYGWVCGLWWGLLLFVVWGWGRGWKEGGREGGGELIRGCCVIVVVLIYLLFPTKHPSFFLLSHLVSFLPSFLLSVHLPFIHPILSHLRRFPPP